VLSTNTPDLPFSEQQKTSLTKRKTQDSDNNQLKKKKQKRNAHSPELMLKNCVEGTFVPCQKCGKECALQTVKGSDSKNYGKTYWRCVPCATFGQWAKPSEVLMKKLKTAELDSIMEYLGMDRKRAKKEQKIEQILYLFR